MDKKEYQDLKLKAFTQYRQAIEHIETVWKMGNRYSNPPLAKPCREMIHQAIERFGEEGFTAGEMREEIEKSFPDANGHIKMSSLSVTLARMVQSGESLCVFRKGRGRRATIYGKIKKP